MLVLLFTFFNLKIFANKEKVLSVQGPVAKRIRHLTTNQGIPGSNPGGVGFLESCFPIVMQTFIFKLIFFGLTQLFFVTNRFLPKNLPRCLLNVNNI